MCLTISFGELLFQTGKALFQLLNGYTLEAIFSLSTAKSFRDPASVSRQSLRREVGLTVLRAYKIFLVLILFCTPDTFVRNRVQSYKISVQLLWTTLKKMQKIFIFFTKSGKIAPKSAGI